MENMLESDVGGDEERAKGKPKDKEKFFLHHLGSPSGSKGALK